MKIGGLGEFESIRKAMQKEEAKKPSSSDSGRSESAVRGDDAVQISEHAKMLGKLRQIPDIRQAEIEKALEKMENGTLMTPEVVKESMARLVENLLGGREE